jgi:hypothetical protein
MPGHLSQDREQRIGDVDRLLRQLKDGLNSEPPPQLRERLVARSKDRHRHRRPPVSLPTLSVLGRREAMAWCAIALTVVFLLSQVRELRRGISEKNLEATVSEVPQSSRPVEGIRATPSASVEMAPGQSRPASRAPRKEKRTPGAARSLTVSLPYSNRAVSLGTSTTVRVVMPQSQLIALGLPLPETDSSLRIVADLTLGDDGLPRAITLPLPLEVVKEN